MNLTPARYTEPGALHYKNAHTGGDPFENVAQPVPRLPVPEASRSFFPSSSWHMPSETGSVVDFSAPGSGSSPAQQAYMSTASDYSRPGDFCYGWEIPSLGRRYEARVLDYPIDLPIAQSQFINGPGGTLDQLFPRIRAYEVVYTDDARTKLGNGMRRLCTNCRATETTTWRRSMLTLGKLLCNKCGLFERTHGVPRPKTFPRRRRSRPSSAYPNVDHPRFDLDLQVAEHHHRYHGRPSSMPLPDFPNALGFMSEDKAPKDTSLMARNMPSISPPPSRLSPCDAAIQQPQTYRADFQLPSAVPVPGCNLSRW